MDVLLFFLLKNFEFQENILEFKIFCLFLRMRIFTEQPLKEYINEHPESRTALQEWASIAKKGQWTCFADMQRDFADVSSAGDRQYVFNLLGSRHSLTAVILFPIQLISIKLIH